MKKFVTVGLLLTALACSVLLCGCSDDSKEEKKEPTGTTAPTPTEEQKEETPSPTPTEAAKGDGKTPVEKHGVLSVKGADLVDEHGEKFQLRGMSTHGIAWFPSFVNAETFTFLRDDWNTNCVRLAMYTAESGGYCTDGDPEFLMNLVKNGIKYATELGMYVIVDWHILSDKTPLLYKDQALAFFEEISKEFGGQDNIVYEICNEPNSSASWADITAYANEVIPVIRANDPDSVIIVGTPTWSQDVDKAAKAPLEFENVMYALHFYAATHKEWLRNRMETCIKGGLPVFVSEFGICDASGNGAVDITQANAWKDLIEKYNVSYMCWNLANKNESSSILKSTCGKLSGWTADDMNQQGIWISEWFKSETD